MAIKPQFEQEDEWESFLDKTDSRARVENSHGKYSWSFGHDDDDGLMRECVILQVPVQLDTVARQVTAKLTPSKLMLQVQGEIVIDDNFTDDRWMSKDDSYWELETISNNTGGRMKRLRYVLYVRSDCPKYITGALFEKEKAANEDSDDDTIDTRMRRIANLKEPEPRRDEDIYFSDEEDFSDPECESCGSKNVKVMKKAEDREFKVYCNDCPFFSPANMNKEAPSLRRQREIDEARARKQKHKDIKVAAKKLELQERATAQIVEFDNMD